MICSKCSTDRTEDQFVWDGVRHKTCRRCKEIRDSKKKNNQNLPARTTNSSNVELVDQFEIINSQETEHNDSTEYVEIDCLEVGDFIADKILELTASAGTDGVANIAYQINLLVNMNIDTQNMTAKEVANLVITEIEGGDDYLWV